MVFQLGPLLTVNDMPVSVGKVFIRPPRAKPDARAGRTQTEGEKSGRARPKAFERKINRCWNR
jgi:hypothetical protein